MIKNESFAAVCSNKVKVSYTRWKWVSQIHAMIGGLAKASEDIIEAMLFYSGL